MDIKFHYICETVLPGKIAVLHIYLPSLHALSHTSVYCSKAVRALLSLLAQSFPAAFFVAVYHAWFEALSLSALLVLSFTPGLLTLFTALSFSSLESS